MIDHTEPTQVAEPRRTTARSVLQFALGLILGAGLVIPAAVVILQEELGQWIPAEWLTVMGTVAAVAVAISGTLTRLMAIPSVNRWLGRLNLSAGDGH